MSYKLDENYKAIDRLEKWDAVTQSVIKERVSRESAVGQPIFFSALEAAILTNIVDFLVYQPPEGGRVDIVGALDEELRKGGKGVRFRGSPWKPESYRIGIKRIREEFRAANNSEIADSRLENVAKFLEGAISDEGETGRFLKHVLNDAITIYYSHPSSWNKLGFPGPAYPEGYGYLDCGKKEKWEPDYS